jgi:hypothetical protein
LVPRREAFKGFPDGGLKRLCSAVPAEAQRRLLQNGVLHFAAGRDFLQDAMMAAQINSSVIKGC